MPWCVLLWVQLLWDSLGSLDLLEVYFLHQFGDIFFHYLFKLVLNFLLFLFSFWHLHDLDVRILKGVPEASKPVLIFLHSCFFILFWLVFISSFYSKSLI